MTTAFETEACTRCGGTGRFSHNGEHDRCYKCDGKNGCRAYTKRGRAAKDYYLSKLYLRPDEVKVGDVIAFYGIKQLTVAKIEIMQSGSWLNPNTGDWEPIFHYVFENEKGLKGSIQKLKNYDDTVANSFLVRRLPTPDENKAAIADALAYQATLTKAGTPRKRG